MVIDVYRFYMMLSMLFALDNLRPSMLDVGGLALLPVSFELGTN